ncbi:di-heme oxidoredictase family protein [Pelagibius sp. Alg239-R121]|uniref:di-heme oxidoredictase family protein n=1 Tax=Pelagibius sp. Alg239-R121 TaxID=2993448 RepID=UPI0024A7410B|nr:di-heme oxidoredictase family protein [Pelagibius sp. Alg239-R121]
MMQKWKWPLLPGLCVHSGLGLLLMALPAKADPAPPWREQARQQVERTAYSGRLTGQTLAELIGKGEMLFTGKLSSLDGVGRPMATQAIIPTKRKRPPAKTFHRTAGLDASSCAGCHHDPLAGGAGGFAVNAFVSEGFNNADFDSTDPQFSNERNTNHLMGSGLIELLAREMTLELQTTRRQALRDARKTGQPQKIDLVSKGVSFGHITATPDGMIDLDAIEGIDSDLVIRPFGQKGVMTSLRQFSVNALNHHHGLQASERFGIRWTGEADFDEDGKRDEISEGDVTALVVWQATRQPPVQLVPDVVEWRAAARKGDTLFDAIGCAACHKPALPLNSLIFEDPGPLDTAGTLRRSDVQTPTSYDLGRQEWAERLARNEKGQILVPLFGDLKRHIMTDRQVAGLGNELLSQRFVERNVFQTTELWGIASTAPYGHRGDMTTLDEVIRAHGGEARASRDSYVGLSLLNREALIAFLKSLVIVE